MIEVALMALLYADSHPHVIWTSITPCGRVEISVEILCLKMGLNGWCRMCVCGKFQVIKHI